MKKTNHLLKDTYAVKFWYKKPNGYMAQKTVYVQVYGKDSHQAAENLACGIYRILPSEIISVTYQ